MKSIFNKLGKILLALSTLCVLFLLIIQFLSYDNNYVIYTSKVNMKNKLVSFSKMEDCEKGLIVLKNMSPTYKEIDILLNGDPIGNFLENDEIEINVYNNDIIEIDGTKYSDNLYIKIIGLSNNIEIPELDTTLTTSQSIEILSKVQLK